MKRARSTHLLTWASAVTLAAITLTVLGGLAVGQDPASAKQPSAERPAAEKPAETPVPEESAPKKTKEFRPRLPSYYGRVVDQKQRERIYGIQREYHPKIEDLRAQLAALIAERDEKIAGVLTPEQRKEVERLQAEARAKRSGAKGAKQGSTAKPSGH
jgi:hypothetical protein